MGHHEAYKVDQIDLSTLLVDRQCQVSPTHVSHWEAAGGSPCEAPEKNNAAGNWEGVFKKR